VVKLRGLPFRASLEDVLRFFLGFELTTSSIYFKRHPDGRPSGEVSPATGREGPPGHDGCSGRARWGAQAAAVPHAHHQSPALFRVVAHARPTTPPAASHARLGAPCSRCGAGAAVLWGGEAPNQHKSAAAARALRPTTTDAALRLTWWQHPLLTQAQLSS
jgi:hypothetical protein